MRWLRYSIHIVALLSTFVGTSNLSLTRAASVGIAQDDGTPAMPDGFSVQRDQQSTIDSLAEFQRYAKQEAWEKAFGSLSKVTDTKPTGLMPSTDGFLVSTRRRIHQALSAISPAGRQAYRLFNDAVAKKELDKAGPCVTAEQIASLRKVADDYFISSVGDVASDRLGDVLFESGDFAGAAEYWQNILTDFPESSIPPVKLMVKRATALARLGRAASVEAIVKSVRDSYADQSVHIAGKDILAVDYLASLQIAPPTTLASSTTQPATQPTEVFAGLPTSQMPLWQVPLLDDATVDRIQQQIQNFTGWGITASSIMPASLPVAFDGKRIYMNWLGYVLAIDQQSGKLLWRSEKFGDVAQGVGTMVQYGESFTDDAIAVAADRVLVIRKQPGNNSYGQPKQLMCLNAANGKQIWLSQNVTALQGWSFGGTPVVVDQTLLAVSHHQNQQDSTLLAIAIKDGGVAWQLPLGTSKAQTNYRGEQVTPSPLLKLSNGLLYIMTNNGALLTIDVQSHSLLWAFKYETQVTDGQQRFFNPYYQRAQNHSSAAMFEVAGTLLMKEADNDRIYAIDPAGPSLQWSRPADADETLSPLNNMSVLLVGADVSLLDLSSRALQWSAALPPGENINSAMVGDGAVCVSTNRGLFQFDLRNGDTTGHFRGKYFDNTAGRLWSVGNKLISISSHAVTAYPVP